MNLEPDLTFAQVVSEQIDEYVHVEVLYYPVGSIHGMQMPQVTIGNWLETEWRLKNAAPIRMTKATTFRQVNVRCTHAPSLTPK